MENSEQAFQARLLQILSFLPGIGKTALCMAILLDILLLFKMSALAYPVNSDHMQSVLEVSDILKGNILLHGWALTSDNFYLSDTPFFLAARLIFGRALVSIYSATFFIYLFLLAAAAGIVLITAATNKSRWLGLAVLLFYLGTPELGGATPWFFVGAQHIAVMAFCLLSWLLLEATLRADHWLSKAKLSAVYGLSVFVPVLSDPLATILLLAPTLFVLSIEILFPHPEKSNRRLTAVILFLQSFAAFGAAHFGLFLIKAFHGFTTQNPTSPLFVDAAGLGTNLAGIFFGLTSLSGGYVYGQSITHIQTFGSIVRLLGLGLMLGSVIVALCRWSRNTQGWDLRFVLALAICADLGSCLTSKTFHSALVPSVLDGGAAIRYLTPVFIFGAVLVAMEISALINFVDRKQRVILGAAFASGLILVFSLFVSQAVTHWRSEPAMATAPGRIAGQWLASQGLTHGVGDYWDANLITALSGQTVSIRAVLGANGKLAPFIWVTNRDWYNTMPPQFVIYTDNDAFGVTPAAIAATYGQPKSVMHVAGYNIALLSAR